MILLELWSFFLALLYFDLWYNNCYRKFPIILLFTLFNFLGLSLIHIVVLGLQNVNFVAFFYALIHVIMV